MKQSPITKALLEIRKKLTWQSVQDKFPKEILDRAILLYNRVINDVNYMGRKPSILKATCVCISSMTFKPESKIPQRDLADIFNTSETVIRVNRNKILDDKNYDDILKLVLKSF